MTAESSSAELLSGPGALSAEPTRVPIGHLRLAGWPRLSPPDPAHVSLLAQVGADLPPLVVHRATMTVIDGAHRLEALRCRGVKYAWVRFFEGSDLEAFVESVRLNSAHGKPLTLQERQLAAVRMLGIYPEWSDRAIARVCGLSPKTVGARRLRRADDTAKTPYRVGLDGKVRRIDGNVKRPRRPFHQTSPDLTCGSAADRPVAVIDGNFRVGKGNPVRGARPQLPEWEPVGTTSPRVRRTLKKDAAWQSTETGRAFARWFDSRNVEGDEWARRVDELPLSRLIEVAVAARACASVWQHLADVAEDRVRRSGSWS